VWQTHHSDQSFQVLKKAFLTDRMRSVGHFPKRHPSQRCLHYPFGARQNAPRSDYPAWSRHTRALPNLR
jgi:hypothetical protein